MGDTFDSFKSTIALKYCNSVVAACYMFYLFSSLAILLKRLKKEKKARRRLAEQIGADSTNTVENGEVPPSSTEAVTKLNGEPMRVNSGRYPWQQEVC